MKRLLVALVLVTLFVSCAGNTPPSITPGQKPAIDTAVAIGRGLARVGIAAELKRAGASDAVVAATLDSLHQAVNDLLAGKSIAEVAKDQASWAAFRELAVKQLAPMLVTAAPVFDEVTAEQLIGTALDIAEAYIKERIGVGLTSFDICGGYRMVLCPDGAMVRYRGDRMVCWAHGGRC